MVVVVLALVVVIMVVVARTLLLHQLLVVHIMGATVLLLEGVEFVQLGLVLLLLVDGVVVHGLEVSRGVKEAHIVGLHGRELGIGLLDHRVRLQFSQILELSLDVRSAGAWGIKCIEVIVTTILHRRILIEPGRCEVGSTYNVCWGEWIQYV